MTAKILDGKAVAVLQRKHLKQQVAEWIKAGNDKPALAVVLVGQDPASQLYVQNKRKACEEVGIASLAYNLAETASQQVLLQLINRLNQDSAVSGILVQLPLPMHIDTNAILEQINPLKDVDGFHSYNLGRLAQKRPALRPCTPYGVIKLLNHYQLPLSGLHAVVVGASNIVGRPMALELLNAGCTVTICHGKTQDLAVFIQTADIVVVAVGNPDVVKAEWIKPGAIVVDVGINRLADGSICGDLNFAQAKERAGWLSPVPGGVGPMTVATLLENTYLAAKNLSNAQ